MKRYQLPDILGGGVYEPLTSFKSKAGDDWRVRFSIPNVGLVDIPMEALTEVAPPEPPPGYYYLHYAPAALGSVAEHEEGYGWHIAGLAEGLMWSDVCVRWPDAVFTRLIPAPEPVALPWEMSDREGYEMGVHPSQRPWAAARVGATTCADLTAADCREMARALWTAADAAEAQS